MPKGHMLAENSETEEINLKVTLAETPGSERMLLSQLGGVEIQAKMHNPRPVHEGENLSCMLSIEKCHLFDAKTGKNLKE